MKLVKTTLQIVALVALSPILIAYGLFNLVTCGNVFGV